jgi:hypothetical protein
MKITNLKYTKTTNCVRSSATIVWEDYDRSPQEIYYETEPEFSDSIHPDPHSFVIASILPALYFGESRLYIDEEICPKLKDGLITAMNLVHHWWYPPNHKIVSIEAKKISTVPADDEPKRAAFCFSGGVDSLATLYHNRLEYPNDHPGYLQDGLLVFGMEVRDIDQFQKVLKLITTIAEDSSITFIPVYTNIIEIGPEDQNEFWGKFWLNEYMSAAFAAIAHAFSKRWHSFSVNSSHDIPNLIPHGSNPLLTSSYSSWGLQLKEEGIALSRVKKVKLIANWDVALQNLRVCNNSDLYEDGIFNCGQCEKCVRTMLALEAAGALQKSTTFPIRSITSETVDKTVRLAKNTLPLYKELVLPLNESGRHDLARAVELKLLEYYQKQRKDKWQKPIIEFDKKYFNGTVKKIKNYMLDGHTFK